jgi:hypothetical protein
MIGVKFFALMARFPDPPVTEAWAFQLSAPANRIAAAAANMSINLRIDSSSVFYHQTRKTFHRQGAESNPLGYRGAAAYRPWLARRGDGTKIRDVLSFHLSN